MAFDISALANLSPADAQAAGMSPTFLGAIQTYAAKGFDLSKLGNQALDIIKDGVTDAEKAEKIALAASEGAAIGACIPLLGEIGVGEILGAVCAGLYSTFDNFGPEIMALINPPAFKESDYDGMRRAGIKAGAIPNPGHAPDNADGCIFPDGTTSGGNYPRHPPPGVQSIRGDTPYTADTAPPDGGDVLADQIARQAQLNRLGGFYNGLKVIDFARTGYNAKLKIKGSTEAERTRDINHLVDMYAKLYAASAPDPTVPVNLVDTRANEEKFVVHPPLLTTADVVASLKGVKLKIIAPLKTPPLVNLKTLPMVHLTVLAAKNGDPAAQQVVGATVDAADKSSAPPATVQTANALDFAAKLQKRATYVQYWLYGDGAKKLLPAA